jgi:signal transduction histidine kinase
VGILITYFVIRSLKIFELEVRRLLEEAKRQRALLEDRERISRELHDGLLQTLYGVGLGLENAVIAENPQIARPLLQQSI